MKRLIPFLFIVALASCAPFGFNPEGYEVLSEPLDIAWPKAAALKYIPDTSPSDEWKSPHETIMDGGGDCEDIATYLMYLLGEESVFIGLKTEYGSHAIVKYHGKYLEPHRAGKYYEYTEIGSHIIREIEYKYIMQRTTHSGKQCLAYEL